MRSGSSRVFITILLLGITLSFPAWAEETNSCQNPKIRESIERVLSYREKTLTKARHLVDIARQMPVEENSRLASRISETAASLDGTEPRRRLASPTHFNTAGLDQALHQGHGAERLEEILKSNTRVRVLLNEKISKVLARKKAAKRSFRSSPVALMNEYLRANQNQRKLSEQAALIFRSLCQQADYLESRYKKDKEDDDAELKIVSD